MKITKATFEKIGSQSGADAIDISQSILHASDIKISDVTDKAISVGEASSAKFSDLKINGALVGIASKDSSKVLAKDVQMRKVALASFMAYNKKPHFSGAQIFSNSVLTDQTLYISQPGSLVEVNGAQVGNKKLNVEALYDEEMKSIK